jgi:hypothetical protein
MDVEIIRQHRLAYPFVPFTVVLKDGRQFPIEQPYFLGISPTNEDVAVAAGPRRFEHFSPDDVDRIELLAGASPGANGNA